MNKRIHQSWFGIFYSLQNLQKQSRCSVTKVFSVRKVFLQVSQILQENTYSRVSSLMKLQLFETKKMGLKMKMSSLFLSRTKINPFVPNAVFRYPLKTWENRKDFHDWYSWLISVTKNGQHRAVSREFFQFVIVIFIKKNTVYKNHLAQIWYLFKNGLRTMLRQQYVLSYNLILLARDCSNAVAYY